MATTDDLEPLLDWLSEADEALLTDLLGRLLRWGREHHAATERAFRTATSEDVNVLGRTLADAVPGEASARLFAEDLRRIASWMRAHAAPRCGDERALAIRLLAKHFDDDARSKAVIARIAAAGPETVAVGGVVPRLSPYSTLKAMYAGRLATRPSTLMSRADLQFFAHLPDELPHGCACASTAGGTRSTASNRPR